MRNHSLLISLLMIHSLVETAAAGSVVFADGTFSDADWTRTLFTLNHPGGTSAQALSGGNPNEHRAVTTFLAAGNPSKVMVVEIRTGATYDPSLQPQILDISYQEDQKCTAADGCLNSGQAWMPALVQNGTFYVHPGGVTGVLESWTTRSITGLVATDYEEIVITATAMTNAASNPDFSVLGAPMHFGYARANSVSNQRTGRIDNWKVTVFDMIVAVELSTWGQVKSLYE